MKRVALILGGANTVFADIEEAYSLFAPEEVFAINDIVEHHEDVDHFCTMHPEKSGLWLANRQEASFDPPKKLWTSHDRVLRAPTGLSFEAVRNTRGGSGLLAIHVALKLGYEKIVLAGIPMEANANHFFNTASWRECRLYQVVWEKDPFLRDDKVRSLSGWTMREFGKPTPEWLAN